MTVAAFEGVAQTAGSKAQPASSLSAVSFVVPVPYPVSSDGHLLVKEFYYTSPSHSRLARTGTTNGTAGDGPLRVVKEAGVLLRPLLPLPVMKREIFSNTKQL